jgi:hypothetical protein
MSYRKITVDGKDYQYTVNVRRFDAVSRASVGQLRQYQTDCWCGSSFCREGSTVYTKLSVKPTDVAAWIKQQKN